MDRPDFGEWVLLGVEQGPDATPVPVDEDLLLAAREAGPKVLAHVRRESGDSGPDRTAIARDVWERVLRSVAKTRERQRERASGTDREEIVNLESYLIGIFHHRFNRVLKRERRREERVEVVSSDLELERLDRRPNGESVEDIERAVTIKQILEQMDEWTRAVWLARKYGYSRREIAERLGLTEAQVKRKFQYGLDKTREKVLNVLKQSQVEVKRRA